MEESQTVHETLVYLFDFETAWCNHILASRKALWKINNKQKVGVIADLLCFISFSGPHGEQVLVNEKLCCPYDDTSWRYYLHWPPAALEVMLNWVEIICFVDLK